MLKLINRIAAQTQEDIFENQGFIKSTFSYLLNDKNHVTINENDLLIINGRLNK